MYLGMQSKICHSEKPKSRDSRYRDLKGSSHLVWMVNNNWGGFLKQGIIRSVIQQVAFQLSYKAMIQSLEKKTWTIHN